MSAERVLEGLDPEQRAVAEAVHGPVIVMAGAGTGKTRAITHRIAYASLSGAHDPRRAMALTYTTRAAGELRDRLAGLGVTGIQARTFHAAARAQLAYFWPRALGGDMPELMPSKFAAVGEAASRCGVSTEQAVIRDLAGEIEWAKASLIAAPDYPAALRALERGAKPRALPAGIDPATAGKVFAAYEEAKDRRARIDFDDLLIVLSGILEERPDIADEVRSQYRWFTVDEYQDITPAQRRLLSAWLGERQDVCVVGDAAQTIYSFAGAQATALQEFAAAHPEATAVKLVRSYRCSPQIVDTANRVLGAMGGSREGGSLVRLRSERPDGPKPVLLPTTDEPAEADAVAQAAAKLIAEGVPPREIAVLFRVNAFSQNYEQAFAEAKVPYVVRGGERYFDRAEVREAITRLRGAARAGEAGMLAGPLADEVVSVLSAMGWTPEAPSATGATRERWESLFALVSLAGTMPEGTDVVGFVAELERRAAMQHAPAADGVTLSSLHAAKGLEWDAVFLVGLVEGTMPIFYALESAERMAEERRLFYVGITRARKHLTLSWSWARNPGGRARERSRFVGESLAPGSPGADSAVVRQGTAKASTERKRKGPASCRLCRKALVTGEERTVGRCRACPSDVNEALFDALKQWRLEVSKERGAPAYTVFTDATLLAIAERLPEAREDLSRISGIGPAKLEAYGETVLELVREHA